MSTAAILAGVARFDLGEVRRLAAARPALLAVTDRQERNLLHVACSASAESAGVAFAAQRRLVEWLLEQGLPLDGKFGRDRCTPLWLAVGRARSPRLVAFLLGRGADVRAAPGHGLFAAGWWEDTRNLALLLDAGADIELVVGVTPFLAAWGWRKFTAARWLARRGADVDHQDPRGWTALRLGVEREFDPAELRWLVRHGASPDIPARDGVTPRRRAARKRDDRWARAMGGAGRP